MDKNEIRLKMTQNEEKELRVEAKRSNLPFSLFLKTKLFPDLDSTKSYIKIYNHIVAKIENLNKGTSFKFKDLIKDIEIPKGIEVSILAKWMNDYLRENHPEIEQLKSSRGSIVYFVGV